MHTTFIGQPGPSPWQVPPLVASVCAAALSLACCALVLFAPDQHAVRRLVQHAIPLMAVAGTLALLSAVGQHASSLTVRDTPTGATHLALDVLVLGGWYVLALAALTLGRAVTLLGGGPLRLQNLLPAARTASGRPPTSAPDPTAASTNMPRMPGRASVLLAVLTAASLVLPLLSAGPAPVAGANTRLMPDIATSLLIVAANASAALAAHFLASDAPRAVRAFLTTATLATALSLAFNLALLLAR